MPTRKALRVTLREAIISTPTIDGSLTDFCPLNHIQKTSPGQRTRNRDAQAANVPPCGFRRIQVTPCEFCRARGRYARVSPRRKMTTMIAPHMTLRLRPHASRGKDMVTTVPWSLCRRSTSPSSSATSASTRSVPKPGLKHDAETPSSLTRQTMRSDSRAIAIKMRPLRPRKACRQALPQRDERGG
jgi:hypothetical protein